MNKIVVIGGGTMGLDIAAVFARTGHQVVVREINDELAAKAQSRLEASLSKQVSRGKMEQAKKDAIQANMTFTTDVSLAADADLVIEAAVEKLEVKQSIFAELDRICKPETILATNTSSISITAIAPRPLHRNALLQPRHRHEAGGGHPGRPHLAGDLRRHLPAVQGHREGTRRGGRGPRLCG